MPSAQAVGIIGSGSFGTAISTLIAHNRDVLLYTRREPVIESINQQHLHFGKQLSPRIQATNDPEYLASRCNLIFPAVPSVKFRQMIQEFSPYLKPYHMLIHATKGFDTQGKDLNARDEMTLTREEVHTMSEVILQESSVIRVGSLSGPNLAAEIMEGQPAAGVIASRFDEVFAAGKAAIDSRSFRVFASHDLLGTELSGALKNAIAIGSGILSGLGLGKNIQAILITRGLIEMILIGKAMGSSSHAFIGTAGIGDLIATATSPNSRNFTFGFRMGRGESYDHISATMPELAEGTRTLRIAHRLSRHYKLHTPIFRVLHAVVFEGFDIWRAMEYLMTYPYDIDVDFL